MGDSKFLIVTTLCYVGIFGVIFIVCCCAWSRHFRKANRGFTSRQRNPQTNRRVYRQTPQPPPDYNVPSTPMPYGAPRGNECAEGIQHGNDGNTYFPVAQHAQGAIVGPMFPGYPRVNLYPLNGVTTRTHAVEITTYGDNRHGGSDGDDFSDAASSRFDGGDSSAFADTDQDKEPARIARIQSPSLESEKEAKSDVSSSLASHLQDVTLQEEQC